MYLAHNDAADYNGPVNVADILTGRGAAKETLAQGEARSSYTSKIHGSCQESLPARCCSVAFISGPTKLFLPSTNHQKIAKTTTPPTSTQVQFISAAVGLGLLGHIRKKVMKTVYITATELMTVRYLPSWKGPYGICSPRYRFHMPSMTGVMYV